MKVNKKYILVILLFVFVICLSYLNKPRVLLSEVKLIDDNKNVKSYAIMLSNDGENYSESESNMIPSTGYKLNTSMSYCVTLTGDTLHGVISEPSLGTVKVDVANTVNCYLYYDPDNSAFATVIEESDYTLYTDEADLEAGTFYRYSGAYDGKRNVIYADHCWQIFRTTKNNSIKMIYNGEPAYNSTLGRYTCENDRTNTDHVGFTSNMTGTRENIGAASGTTYNYYYGTGYYYDDDAGAYKLSNEVGPYNYYNDYNTVIGMYTCKKTSANASCTMGQIYYVESYYSQTQAYVFTINTGMTYDRIGKTQFNYKSSSPADVGYMYNTRYERNNKSTSVSMLSIVSLSSSNLTTYSNYYYGDRTEGSNALNNPVLGSSITGYPQSLVGKYTLRSSNQSYTNSTSYYISGITSDSTPKMYYARFSNNTTKDSAANKYLFGTGFTSNNDGNYNLTEAQEISIGDWYTKYSSVSAGNYVCFPETYTYNSVNSTGVCSSVNYIMSVGAGNVGYLPVNIKYGYSFEERNAAEQQDGKGRYKLVGNNDLTNSLHVVTNWGTEYNTLNNSHYTCFNEEGICDTLYFVTYTDSTSLYYIEIPANKTISTILDEMLNNNGVNINNSAMKSMLELWYKEHILNKEDTNHNQYSSYLDTDEIFCNNRYVTNPGGWSQTGSTTAYLKLSGYTSNPTYPVSCVDTSGNERVIDEFSVTSGNEALTYPIGLPTIGELYIETMSYNESPVRKSPYGTGVYYWLSSPGTFSINGSYGGDVKSGSLSESCVSDAYGARPAVSLNTDVTFISGDGTMTDPWIASLE